MRCPPSRDGRGHAINGRGGSSRAPSPLLTYAMPSIRLLHRAVGAVLALAVGAGLAGSGYADTQADAIAAERGEQVFLSRGCVYCHENGGRAAGKGPQLMGASRDDAFIAFRITNGKV